MDEKNYDSFINTVKEIKEKKINKKKCKVLITAKKYSVIDFDGFGITVDKTDDKYVTIKYIGEIGTSEFEIIK